GRRRVWRLLWGTQGAETMDRTRDTRERGASLVEVMVTMALMSLLMTAFAASVETRATGSQTEGASRSLLGDLQLARQRAITEARDCRAPTR
ncbi:MAG: hypothetical protein COZ33_07235, partial [Nitrospirae bacterium CG_4_10_14_3_um_filter_70_108]